MTQPSKSTKNNESYEATNRKRGRVGAHSGRTSRWLKNRWGRKMPSTRELSNRLKSKAANITHLFLEIDSLLGREQGFRFNINEFVEEVDLVDVREKVLEFSQWIEILKKATQVLEEEGRKRKAKEKLEQETRFKEVKEETERMKRVREREAAELSTKDFVLNEISKKKANVDEDKKTI